MGNAIMIQSIISAKTIKKKISKISLKKILAKHIDFINLIKRMM
jgi:hypothetical protein